MRAQGRKYAQTPKQNNIHINILMHFKKYNKREYKILLTVKNKEQ